MEGQVFVAVFVSFCQSVGQRLSTHQIRRPLTLQLLTKLPDEHTFRSVLRMSVFSSKKRSARDFSGKVFFLLLDSRDSFKKYIGSYIHVTSWTLRTGTENVSLTLSTFLVYIKTKFVFLCKSE